MKVLVTGSTGFVGSALVDALRARGDTVATLKRPGSRAVQPGDPLWDPRADHVQEASLEGFDAVVHLAGENIAAARWDARRKARIRDSRVHGTKLLAGALARLRQPPAVLVCASATGFYGDRGDAMLDERSPAGRGFLSEVCIEWEDAATAAHKAGIRTVHLRSGIVLDAQGGPLARMLLPFRCGIGGRLGNGQQYMSWVTLDDTIAIQCLAMDNEALRGPVNCVAPQPVRNVEFTRTLGRVLGRPAFLRVPAWAVRLLFGEMADALLFASTRVVPGKLAKLGYRFQHADLESALRELLRKPEETSATR